MCHTRNVKVSKRFRRLLLLDSCTKDCKYNITKLYTVRGTVIYTLIRSIYLVYPLLSTNNCSSLSAGGCLIFLFLVSSVRISKFRRSFFTRCAVKGSVKTVSCRVMSLHTKHITYNNDEYMR